MDHAGKRTIAEIAIVVALPETVRGRLEKRFRDRLELRIAVLKFDGKFALERNPEHSRQIIEQWAEEATSYDRLALLTLPYARYPQPVEETLWTLRQLGAAEVNPPIEGWPAMSRPFDNAKQAEVINAVSDALDQHAPPLVQLAQVPEDHPIEVDLLRGLVTHSKMGENNHSHEDDLWRGKGQSLGAGDRDRIVGALMQRGILSRKKNMSRGGTGWVYWISDVKKARGLYPELEPWLKA